MSKIYCGVACNLDADMLAASLPLLEAGEVEALEWSFDALWEHPNLPEWFTELLHTFGHSGRLIGHGVFYSLFSGRWMPEQELWLKEISRMAQTFRFDHVTEHFGYMTGLDFHRGAPLGVPLTAETLALGIDRLKRFQNAALCPVGLENLAFAHSVDEAERHGIFLEQLVSAVNGFIILDVHNLYCHLHNFDLDFESIIHTYPLERVREIHVSGGSWESVSNFTDKQIRRDTHDNATPEAVFELLARVLEHCPNVQYVILEQLGIALKSEAEREQFRADFRVMKQITRRCSTHKKRAKQTFLSSLPHLIPSVPLENEDLYQQQRQLAFILENAHSIADAQHQLTQTKLAHSAWKTESWPPEMLETAIAIAQKWR